jgi:ABC-type histidine transport system ATPase subunit
VLFDILTSASDTGLICECLRAVASASKRDNLVMVLHCINFFFFANRVHICVINL